MDQHLTSIFPRRDNRRSNVSLSGLRVLVIDDHRDTRETLAILLCQRSIQVALADSGLAALDLLTEMDSDDLPDVLICDIAMPIYDGYLTLAKIRQWEALCGRRIPIPAIAFTAFSLRQDKLKAAAYGFQAHLTKPLMPELLFSTLADMVRLRKSHS